MPFPRSSGILLHPTSLPGPGGIGTLGPEAHRFARFLHDAGIKIWQVLPLGPTGFGDSPYQCFSAFAGNPLLIHLDGEPPSSAPLDRIAFESVIPAKRSRLRHAFESFAGGAAFDAFRQRHARWLDDYALFLALKNAHGGEAVWTEWPEAVRRRDPDTLERWRVALAREIEFEQFQQFLFFSQWEELRALCRSMGIRMMGDLPIYVAHDSADVWANPELFELEPSGRARAVAGVPPDYFSATGQLWGNPIYRWDEHARTGYTWWIERLRATFAMVDYVRLDHFRGFEAYWEVPGGEPTAEHGRWVQGPGAAFFEAAQAALGGLPLVAENLGVITPAVESIRERFGFPGMSILQFGFGSDPQAPDFRPHNFPRSRAAYTGTHDNDTTVGWWTSSGAGDSTRTAADIEKERAFTRAYFNTAGSEIHWTFIRAVLASVADLAILPMQDALGLGSEARMNVPAKTGGNWRWRMQPGACTPDLARRLKELNELYDR